MNTQLWIIPIALTASVFISCQETNPIAGGTSKINKSAPMVKSLSTPTAPTIWKESAVTLYKLAICIVSGEELGSMGEPTTEIYHGQEIKFCCKPCVKKFHASPEKYIDKLTTNTTTP